MGDVLESDCSVISSEGVQSRLGVTLHNSTQERDVWPRTLLIYSLFHVRDFGVCQTAQQNSRPTMTSSVLETQRRAHEERERFQDLVAAELATRHRKHIDKLVQQHRIHVYLDRIQERSRFLIDSYADADGARKAEIEAISNPPGNTDFVEFYNRLKDVKDHFRRHPDERIEVLEVELGKVDEDAEMEAIENMFSGEEMRGRFLDLNAPFELYINLKNVRRINYLAYISEFDKFAEGVCGVSAETRKGAEYKRYLTELVGYLENFLCRAMPLYDLNGLKAEVTTSVDEWAQSLDEEMTDPELFCAPCGKQFAKKSVFDGHLPGKKHKKAAEAFAANGAATIPGTSAKTRPSSLEAVKLLEVSVQRLAEALAAQREDTRDLVERKQTLSADEIEKAKALYDNQDYGQEEEEHFSAEEEEEEEDNNEIYNPLKLPMGWDGKPIPYWLYRLHGLGVEYPCEICGNFVYMGRKAFERHFQEWRHAHGMRCLGIPNTKHFQEITKIQDAYSLWEKLNSTKKAELFKADAMEEFEDAEGNVFNKKTFEDLRRQGLL
ncbi:hypothetical protein BC830DRAFT_1111582 [Chytriomyces sp. MP71]|nr:hypothetical protein BC830DRAFT_1111582 [Chytriomyces sp. MP71]